MGREEASSEFLMDGLASELSLALHNELKLLLAGGHQGSNSGLPAAEVNTPTISTTSVS